MGWKPLPRGSEEQHSDLDVAIVHRLLSDELDDFNEFAAQVNRFISRDPSKKSG